MDSAQKSPDLRIECEIDGVATERTYTCVRFALAVKAYVRDLRRAYCAEHSLKQDTDISWIHLLEFIFSDEQRVNDAMRAMFDGNHEGVNWYRDVDPDAVEVAVGGFFVHTLLPRLSKTDESTTSSGSTPRSSEEEATPDVAPASI